MSILFRILTHVDPNFTDADYDIVHCFPAKTGFTRHSCLITVKDSKKKKDLLTKCKKLKDLGETHAFKKVFIRYEQTPLMRKENTRLWDEYKKLNDTHKNDENMKVRLEKGKLFLNADVVDQFSLTNQIF